MEPIELTMRVLPDERSVRLGRRFIAHALLLFGHDELEPSASLLVSELLGNAIRYAQTEVTLSINGVDQGVRVAVTDDGPGDPELVAPRAPIGMTGGRGLQVVDRLADRWGIERNNGTKTVWFEVLAPAGVGSLPTRVH